MLSMTENGGIQLFLFLFLFMSGVACSVVEQSLATAKLRKNSEKNASCQLFVHICLQIGTLGCACKGGCFKKNAAM